MIARGNVLALVAQRDDAHLLGRLEQRARHDDARTKQAENSGAELLRNEDASTVDLDRRPAAGGWRKPSQAVPQMTSIAAVLATHRNASGLSSLRHAGHALERAFRHPARSNCSAQAARSPRQSAEIASLEPLVSASVAATISSDAGGADAAASRPGRESP